MTQASDFFPESRESAAPVPAEPSTDPQLEDEQRFAVEHAAADARSPVELPDSQTALPDDADLLPETPELLKRPESVIFLLFISLFVFWDAYVDFIEDSFSPDTTAISASQLARRLSVSRKAIRRRKRDRDFSDWTQSLDPDGIAWTYRKGYYLSQP